jgi:molybdopterin molybdotransferase
LISVSEALQRLLTAFIPVDTELVPLEKSTGRVISEEIKSDIDLPLFTNSSMDGFAIRAEDVVGATLESPVKLSVVEHIPAG